MARRRTRRTATTAATVCAALAIAAAAALLPGEPGARTRTALLASSTELGEIRIANSRRGQPILTAVGLGPGSVARGEVRIANVGGAPAKVTLRALGLRDTLGVGGLALSRGLVLRVVRRRVRFRAPLQNPPGRARRIVYQGPLAEMRGLRLGRWAVGAHRRFRFRVELPDDAGASSGAYQGASASLRFAWRARRAP